MTLYEPVLIYKLVAFTVAILMRMSDLLNIFLTYSERSKTARTFILSTSTYRKSFEAMTALERCPWANMHKWDPGYHLRMLSFADFTSLRPFKNSIQVVIDTRM